MTVENRPTSHGLLWKVATGLLGQELADEVLGDLLEEARTHGNRTRSLGPRALALAVAIRYRQATTALMQHLPRRASNSVETTKRLATASTTAMFMSSLRLDVLQTLRSLRRTPALTAAVLLTLTLGIGATSAMFTVVRSVLLRPLPYPEPAQLLRLGTAPLTAAQINELRELEAITGVTAVGSGTLILQHQGVAIELRGLLGDAEHHRVIGVAPAIGRALEPNDSLPGAEPVVVLSHSTWTNYFDADPAILGRSIELSGQGESNHTVIGVHPPQYRPAPWTAHFLVPHRYQEGSHDWTDMARFWAVGRSAAETERKTVQLAARDLIRSVADRGGAFNVETADQFTVLGLLDARVGSVQQRLWLLFAVVGVVLLIACANVANLLLVRGIARTNEFSLRSALGAGRGQLVRQLITEGSVLAGIGGALGVSLAALSLPVILNMLPVRLPRAQEIYLDPTVLAFSVLVSVTIGAVFGLVPLSRTSRGLVAIGPRGGGQLRGAGKLNGTLVAAQLALSLVLLSSCGLLVRSLIELRRVDPGIQVEHVHSARLSPPTDRYPEDMRAPYIDQVEEAVGALPSVEMVGSISNLPLTGALLGVGISPDGRPVPPSNRPLHISYRAITPGFLDTAGATLLRGRNINAGDRSEASPVGLVNQKLAHRLWPNRDPIGEDVFWSTGERWFKVVGVVADVRQANLATESSPQAYLPYAQEAWVSGMFVLARSSRAGGVELEMQKAIESVDPLVPITEQRTMAAVLGESMASNTFNAYFFGGFAVLGLLLSVIGVYGVTLHSLSQRTSELGVRMALGANAARLVLEVTRTNFAAVGVGLIGGLALSWMASQSLRSMLFAVTPYDPAVMLGTSLALGGGALVVSAVAASRVSRLDPGSVLGTD